jgi:hypothetical protein
MLDRVTISPLEATLQYEMYALVKKDVILRRVGENLASYIGRIT